MDIQRIDNYTDTRFSKTVLEQHGAYLIDGDPYEIEITGSSEATVRGKDPAAYAELIEEFRFHAPHIVRFFDDTGSPLAEYPVPEIIEVKPEQIQPSQFFVDEEKLAAIRTFIQPVHLPGRSYPSVRSCAGGFSIREGSYQRNKRMGLALCLGSGEKKNLQSPGSDPAFP